MIRSDGLVLTIAFDFDISNKFQPIIISLIKKVNSKGISKIKYIFKKHIQGFSPGIEGTTRYNEIVRLEKDLRKKQGQLKRNYTLSKKKHPFNPKSSTIEYSRHRFVDIQDLHDNIRINHQQQTLRYRFDIQLGFNLRNVETGELMMFYPSDQTSIFDDGIDK